MNNSEVKEECGDGAVLTMDELDCNVVFVDDWVSGEFVGQEQIITAEELTDMNASGVETYFIEVADDLSVLNYQETDNKTCERKATKRKCHQTTAPENCDIDLSWLIGFKLDGILNNSVLDDTPQVDAKKSDSSYHEMRQRPLEKMKETVKEYRKKPPFTYTELIECALQEKGPLTVSEIYQWISDTFPYYQAHDIRWKNSVRHNLSINPYFRKGSKAKQGSGHLWTVSPAADSAKGLLSKRQRFQEFKAYTRKIKLEWKREEEENDLADAREAEIAAAIIENKENRVFHPALQRDALLPTNDEGDYGKKVKVEFVQVPKLEEKNDFLYPPVSKEDLIGECGFFSQIELNLTAETEQLEQTFEPLEEELELQFSDVSGQCPQLCL